MGKPDYCESCGKVFGVEHAHEHLTELDDMMVCKKCESKMSNENLGKENDTLKEIIREASVDLAVYRNMLDESENVKNRRAIDAWFLKAIDMGIRVCKPACWDVKIEEKTDQPKS